MLTLGFEILWIAVNGFSLKFAFILWFCLDPFQWNVAHVKHWIQWAVKKFQLVGVDVKNFNLTGQQLAGLTHEEFVRYIPNDRNDIFWTHLELLRKCRFVGRFTRTYTMTTFENVQWKLIWGDVFTDFLIVEICRWLV